MPAIIHPRENAFLRNDGLLPYGAYDDIISDTSTAAWDGDGGFVKRRRTQRKTWIFCGVYSKDLMTGMAIADAGYIATAFAYFYVPSQNLYKEQKVIVPFGFANDFDAALTGSWNLRNFSIHTIGSVMRTVSTGKFQLQLELENNACGLSFICPSEDRPFNFTYKNLCLNARASVFFDGQTFEAEGRLGGIDFSKGYPPRRTRWNWAMIIGSTPSGVPVGLNLFTGHNGKYENAAWIGEERYLLPDTAFEFDGSQPLDGQDWRLASDMADIEFHPSHARSEKINAGLISHDFIQPFGRFEGIVRLPDGEIPFTGYGPVEDHESLW